MSEEISNEKLFEFMTRMYGEMQGMKENMATKEDLANTNQAISNINQSIADTNQAISNINQSIADTNQAISNINQSIVDTNQAISNINQSIVDTNQSIAKTNQTIVRLENKMDENHKALYDGYKLIYEKLNILEKKVDQHDVEIKIIKTAK
ncbi:MAG: hypothetical protein M0P14_01500 [Alkaliphilus sp.]|nr:hypothetical protein [Alkaliphilus sp.]